MQTYKFLSSTSLILHKKYEAMRAFFYERLPAEEVARKFGYSVNNVYSMTKNFKQECLDSSLAEKFFVVNKKGRKVVKNSSGVADEIIELRKKYLLFKH